MPDDVVDTGLGGGLMFNYIWVNEDPLSKHIKPLRYGRCEIDYGGDHLAEGVIINVLPAVSKGEEVEGAWELTVTVGPPDAELVKQNIEREREIMIRVLA